MNLFYNINPIFCLILLILVLTFYSLATNENNLNNYQHFNEFFCSGWAGKCFIK